MKTFGRILLSLLAALCGFMIASSIGLGISLLFGSNVHEQMPAVFGLVFGVVGGVVTFRWAHQRMSDRG